MLDETPRPSGMCAQAIERESIARIIVFEIMEDNLGRIMPFENDL